LFLAPGSSFGSKDKQTPNRVVKGNVRTCSV
jgi:hypothetical protein